MNKRYFIVSTDLEATTIKNQCGADVGVLVMKHPLYKHDLPVKELDKLEHRSFKFQYENELSALNMESDNIVALSSHDDEGMLWAAQLHHRLKPDDGVSTYEDIQLVTYTCLNTDRLDMDSVWSPDKLRACYRKWIHQSIIAQVFYWKVSRDLGLKLFKSKKKALSLGLSRLLVTASVVDNPACYGISIPSQHGDVSTTWSYDAYDAPPFVYDFSENIEDVKTNIFEPYLPTNVEILACPTQRIPGLSKTVINDYYDPYIHCLLTYTNNKYYRDMIHMGLISATSKNREAPTLVNLQESLYDRFNDLVEQGVCTSNDWDSLNAYLINTVVSDNIFNTSFVLKSLPDNLRYEYSLLYDHLNTKMFQAYLHPHAQTYLKASVVTLSDKSSYSLDNFTSHLYCVDSDAKSSRLTMLGPDAYLRLNKNHLRFDHATHSFETYSIDFKYDVIDSPRYMALVFHALSTIYDYRRSYIATLIHQAVRRGFITITGSGMRLTTYGHSVASSIAECFDDKLGSDALNLGASNAFTDPQWEMFIDVDLDSLKTMKKKVADFEGITHKTKFKKNNKVQKRVYKLVLDNKTKTAYFKYRKRKKPVWYKVRSVELTNLDLPRKYDLLAIDYTLVPAPRSLNQSKWIKNCSCGNKEHAISTQGDKLTLTCFQCSEQSEMPFIIITHPKTPVTATA